MVYDAIKGLVEYGRNTGLLKEEDEIYARNQILEVLKLDEYEEPADEHLCFTEETKGDMLEAILSELLQFAVESGRIEDTITQKDAEISALQAEIALLKKQAQ